MALLQDLEPEHPRPRRRGLQVFLTVVLLVALAAGGVIGYRLFVDDPVQSAADRVSDAEQQVRTFAKEWSAGNLTAASKLTDDPAGASSLLISVNKNLSPQGLRITAGSGSADNTVKDSVVVPLTFKMTVPKVGAFSYESKARVVGETIAFDSTLVHPALKQGQTLAVAKMSDRGAILDRGGNPLSAASLVGQVDPQTGMGLSGLQKRYNDQLAGSGSSTTRVVAVTDRESGKALRSVNQGGGKDVRTTIDPKVQKAAAQALEGAKVPASLVAIQPSTGDILAVANRPGGFNRALVGKYPPGSTFKVITAAALLEKGVKPSDELDCPKFEWVNGFRFANQDNFALPKGSTFRQAFARSCNTAFILAREQLDDDTLSTTAAAFGIGGTWDTGTSTYDGSVPVNSDANDLAAAVLGQGRNLASPLVMASVAATVKSGTFIQPRLVPDAVKDPYQATGKLSPQVVRDLRSMMRSVVTEGAGDALKPVAGEPHAKTGTAEFGSETPPQTHAWMIGYQGKSDIAWAVLLEGGGSGGKDAGPIAAAFLKGVS